MLTVDICKRVCLVTREYVSGLEYFLTWRWACAEHTALFGNIYRRPIFDTYFFVLLIASQWRRNGSFAWAKTHADRFSHQLLFLGDLAMGDERLLLKLISLCLFSLWVKPRLTHPLCKLFLTWLLWHLQTIQWVDTLGLLPLLAVSLCSLLHSMLWDFSPSGGDEGHLLENLLLLLILSYYIYFIAKHEN